MFGEPGGVFGGGWRGIWGVWRVFGEPGGVFGGARGVFGEAGRVFGEGWRVFGEPGEVFREAGGIFGCLGMIWGIWEGGKPPPTPRLQRAPMWHHPQNHRNHRCSPGGDADTPGQPTPPPPCHQDPHPVGTLTLCTRLLSHGDPPPVRPQHRISPGGSGAGGRSGERRGCRAGVAMGSGAVTGTWGGGTQTLEVPPPCTLRAAPRTPRGADWCRGSRTTCRPRAPRRSSPAAPRWARPCARSCVGRGGEATQFRGWPPPHPQAPLALSPAPVGPYLCPLGRTVPSARFQVPSTSLSVMPSQEEARRKVLM